MGVQDWIKTFRDALRGVRELLFSEKHSLIFWVVGCIGFLLSWLLSIDRIEWLIIIFATGLVFVAEAFNTAIEHVVDLVSPEYHSLARKAKDIAAGAVLLMAFISTAIGMLIFVPKIVALF